MIWPPPNIGGTGIDAEIEKCILQLPRRRAAAARDAVLAALDMSMRTRAARLAQCGTRMAKSCSAVWLAPEIVHAISEGRQPAPLTSKKLLITELPLCWAEQKKMLGVA
jgi:hypothetical protein